MKNVYAYFRDYKNCNLAIPDFDQFARYNAVEIDPVFVFYDEFGQVDGYERTDEAEIKLHPYWNVVYSVYLHHDAEHPDNRGFGGAQCIGDFPSLEIAQTFAAFMDQLLNLANYVRTTPEKQK